MAQTSYTPSITKNPRDSSGSDRAFAWTKSDANYFENPNDTGKVVVSKGIYVSASDQAYVFTRADGNNVTYPAGMLATGVCHPIHAVRYMSTGSGTGTIVVEHD